MPRIERRERVPLLHASGPRARRRRRRRRRRAALQSRQHGWLRRRRGRCRGATREQPRRVRLIEPRVHGRRAHGAGVEPGTCVEIATGAPMPAGADAVIMVEETARRRATGWRSSRAVQPRTEHRDAGRGHRHGQVVLRAGEVLNAEPHRRPGRAGHAGRRRVGPAVGGGPLDRQRDRRRRARRSRPGRSTTSTASRCRRWSSEHGGVAVPDLTRRATRSRPCTRRSTSASATTSSCSPAAARSANAISSSTSSASAARCAFTASR